MHFVYSTLPHRSHVGCANFGYADGELISSRLIQIGGLRLKANPPYISNPPYVSMYLLVGTAEQCLANNTHKKASQCEAFFECRIGEKQVLLAQMVKLNRRNCVVLGAESLLHIALNIVIGGFG